MKVLQGDNKNMSTEKKIKIVFDEKEIAAELNDSETAQRIWDALPLKSVGSLWGEEIYFNIPVKYKAEDPKEIVNVGDLAYWPEGACFCIFWGPTPISVPDEIRPASGVNIVGKVTGEISGLKKYISGTSVLIRKLDD